MSKYLPYFAGSLLLAFVATGLLRPGTSITVTDQEEVELGSNAVSIPLAATQATSEGHGVKLLSLNNKLQITAALRDLFDYYLQDLGPDSLQDVSARVQQALAAQLQGQALQQAQTIFADYLSYRQALSSLDQQYQLPDDVSQGEYLALLQDRQRALVALQDQILGPDVAGILFAFDRRLDNYTLEKAALMASDIADDARQQALLNLQAGLPEATRLQQYKDQQQQRLLAIDHTDLSAVQRYEQRAQLVGGEAAQRLSQLDSQRANWQQRLDNFRRDIAQVKEAGLEGADAEQAYQRLLAAQFDSSEWLRVRALTGLLTGSDGL